MMTIYEDTNPKRLLDLLGLVEAGGMDLPEFQRNFTWKASEAQANSQHASPLAFVHTARPALTLKALGHLIWIVERITYAQATEMLAQNITRFAAWLKSFHQGCCLVTASGETFSGDLAR